MDIHHVRPRLPLHVSLASNAHAHLPLAGILLESLRPWAHLDASERVSGTSITYLIGLYVIYSHFNVFSILYPRPLHNLFNFRLHIFKYRFKLVIG